jgi:thiamine biosynthesis lipoprotein
MNSNARKNIVYSLVLLAMVLLVYAWRNREVKSPEKLVESSQPGKISFVGSALDTEYRVTYLDRKSRNLKSSIDSLFTAFSMSASLSEPTSELNRLNVKDTLASPSSMLIRVLAEANRMYDFTSGAFDPTQKPIDDAWAFSTGGIQRRDSTDLRILLSSVGLIRKTSSGIFVDLSRSIRGFAMDLIGEFLEQRGITDYLIQIGGENLAKGINDRDELWRIGLYYLSDSLGTRKDGAVALKNQAISSVGNFQQFYTRDSLRRSFTLDPRTGLPVTHGLLAATVIGPNAKTADALADAVMVMGWREAIRLDSTHEDVHMLLIYNEQGGRLKQYVSPELSGMLSFPIK